MIRRFKNNKLSADVWAGQIIQPGQYFTIEWNDLKAWQNDQKVLDDIASGNGVINDGTNDITDPDKGKAWLQYTDDKLKLKLRGISRSYVFTDSGSLGGTRWFRCAGGSDTSNNTPAIIPFNLRAISLEFTNSSKPTELFIDIFRERDGVASKIFTWDVSGVKSKYKTNGMENTLFLPKDRIAVRGRQDGITVANDSIVRIDFVILDEKTGEDSVT